jgi:hypothetical protein
MITAGGIIRTNTKVKGDTYSYVEIFVATTTASELSVTAMIAQILPEADSVPTGKFISGKGTTGLQFAEFPQIEYYSANINNGQVGMSVSLAEL